MPWKNGGGITYEVIAHPPGAGLDAFDWRISMARLQSSGPFSHFDGISRTLAMIEGEAELTVAGAAPVRLSPGSEPLAFPGDADTHGELISPSALDLNVMARREVCEARLSRGSAPGTLKRAPTRRRRSCSSRSAIWTLGRRTPHPPGRRPPSGATTEPVQIGGQGGYWLVEILGK